MTYEKDIPDYAMVPARELEEKIVVPITKGAIYSPVQVTNVTEKPKTLITVEEDILVPDTKPDLQKILMIDGKVRLAGREVDQISKNDDYINLSGEIELQTLYLPEKQEGNPPIISIQTRVPFKDQWHTSLSPGATLVLDCGIEKIEHMVVNERKYRVKISLEVHAKEYADSKIDFFEGLANEEIQVLKERLEITNTAMRKKDMLSVSEDLEIKDDEKPENILRQDISVVENYKQVTMEKVVVNGFIYVNLLYTVKQVDENVNDINLRHAQERLEFTQFIPLQQGGEWSGSNLSFDGGDLKVKLVCNDEGKDIFRVEGDIITYIEIYSNTEKDIIVDGYHREKDFICDFKKEHGRTLVGTTAGEASMREIISSENAGGEVENILYVTAEVLNASSRGEQGKVITEGHIMSKFICQSSGDEAAVFSISEKVPFRVVTSVQQISGEEKISQKVHIKDLWAEKINGKQIEFNATVAVFCEIMRPTPFKVLINPAFEQSTSKEAVLPMVVYVVKRGDTLWSIAKKYKTTVESVSQLNKFENEQVSEGQKLLILR